MYKLNKKQHRIDWIYSEYANKATTSLSKFIEVVNKAYYESSSNLYASRFVVDIHHEYNKMFSRINLQGKLRERFIVDIGGGTGFEYELINNLKSLDYTHFRYIEPSEDMMNIFLDGLDKNTDERLSVHNGKFSEVVDELKSEHNKLLIMNSTLHHVIRLESFLDEIKSSMRAGDIFILGHEPNNDYPWFFNLFQQFIRVFVTSAIIKRIQLRFKKSKVNGDRWKMINQKLLKQMHIIKEMKPLLIRRVIDYGVGYKNDWETLGIPKDYDEGFWNVADLSNYLGPNIKLIYFKSYRHLGDSRGNLVIEILNRVLSTLFKRYGTNFIAVWEKC